MDENSIYKNVINPRNDGARYKKHSVNNDHKMICDVRPEIMKVLNTTYKDSKGFLVRTNKVLPGDLGKSRASAVEKPKVLINEKLTEDENLNVAPMVTPLVPIVTPSVPPIETILPLVPKVTSAVTAVTPIVVPKVTCKNAGTYACADVTINGEGLIISAKNGQVVKKINTGEGLKCNSNQGIANITLDNDILTKIIDERISAKIGICK